MGSLFLQCGCVVEGTDISVYCVAAVHLFGERVLEEDERSQACL